MNFVLFDLILKAQRPFFGFRPSLSPILEVGCGVTFFKLIMKCNPFRKEECYEYL
jgi:hypothetical protein